MHQVVANKKWKTVTKNCEAKKWSHSLTRGGHLQEVLIIGLRLGKF